ncbi:sensor histidine kinase [Pseudonocardia saturnea]
MTLRARAQGGQVRVEVADDGPGLPRGAADAVRRRGVRGPDSTGCGLGLAITGGIVESHRGTFALLSQGRGCTAVVLLPAAVRAVEHVGA